MRRLNFGIRLLQGQVHYYHGEMRMCHSYCVSCVLQLAPAHEKGHSLIVLAAVAIGYWQLGGLPHESTGMDGRPSLRRCVPEEFLVCWPVSQLTLRLHHVFSGHTALDQPQQAGLQNGMAASLPSVGH